MSHGMVCAVMLSIHRKEWNESHRIVREGTRRGTGVSVQSIRRAYWKGLIPSFRFQKMLRFDLVLVRKTLLERGLLTMRQSSCARPSASADGAQQKPPIGKTGALATEIVTGGPKIL